MVLRNGTFSRRSSLSVIARPRDI